MPIVTKWNTGVSSWCVSSWCVSTGTDEKRRRRTSCELCSRAAGLILGD
ncbi:MAG: hypothetical protein ACRCUY_13890 [Thermoguttaceae bacterium]